MSSKKITDGVSVSISKLSLSDLSRFSPSPELNLVPKDGANVLVLTPKNESKQGSPEQWLMSPALSMPEGIASRTFSQILHANGWDRLRKVVFFVLEKDGKDLLLGSLSISANERGSSKGKGVDRLTMVWRSQLFEKKDYDSSFKQECGDNFHPEHTTIRLDVSKNEMKCDDIHFTRNKGRGGHRGFDGSGSMVDLTAEPKGEINPFISMKLNQAAVQNVWEEFCMQEISNIETTGHKEVVETGLGLMRSKMSIIRLKSSISCVGQKATNTNMLISPSFWSEGSKKGLYLGAREGNAGRIARLELGYNWGIQMVMFEEQDDEPASASWHVHLGLGKQSVRY